MLKTAKACLDIWILVSNIGFSLNLYQYLLGLEFLEKRPVWFGIMYRLHFGNSAFKLIDLNSKPVKSHVALEGQLGFCYVTFVINNLSELCLKLRSQGIPFFIPKKEIRPSVQIAMVKDLDGNIVEFVERN